MTHDPKDLAAEVQDWLREDGAVAGTPRPADLGDLVVALLGSTLAGLRDHLEADGFDAAAGLVDDLVEIVDDYLVQAR